MWCTVSPGGSLPPRTPLVWWRGGADTDPDAESAQNMLISKSPFLYDQYNQQMA